MSRTLALVLVLLILAPASASASEVVRVRADGAVVRADDPWLPAVGADCATPPEPVAGAVTAAAAAKAPTLTRTLDRLVRLKFLSAEDRNRHIATMIKARHVRDRLRGRLRTELSASIGIVQSLVRRRLLTSTRVAPVFRMLERNVEYWPKAVFPAPAQPPVKPCTGAAGVGGARVEFDGDPVVYQWYPGQGLQIQQLGTFGRINAMARTCLGPPSTKHPCELDRVRAGLTAIEELAVTRGGFATWEYYFAFGGGVPPWVSGLAQGTAIQTLTRGSQLFSEPRYLALAKRALGIYRTPPPIGVRASGPRGPHYLLYSFNPGLRVFNAFFQALNGLYDYAQASGDQRAWALFHAGDREARREVRLADTGAWSRYSIGGLESDLGYHRLVRDFLLALCDRTKARAYCKMGYRFLGYQQEPTRVLIRSAGRAGVRVVLSKISCVTLTVDGHLVTGRVLRRGEGVLPWTPRPGRHTVSVDAKDLSGHHTVVERRVRVRRPSRG